MRQYFLCFYEGFDLALMVFYFLVERNYNLFDFQVCPPEIPDLSFNPLLQSSLVAVNRCYSSRGRHSLGWNYHDLASFAKNQFRQVID
jgi:hypothetical protein